MLTRVVLNKRDLGFKLSKNLLRSLNQIRPVGLVAGTNGADETTEEEDAVAAAVARVEHDVLFVCRVVSKEEGEEMERACPNGNRGEGEDVEEDGDDDVRTAFMEGGFIIVPYKV